MLLTTRWSAARARADPWTSEKPTAAAPSFFAALGLNWGPKGKQSWGNYRKEILMVFRTRKDDDREQRRDEPESRREARSYRTKAEDGKNYYDESGLLEIS
jgi:hypothetical protein